MSKGGIIIDLLLPNYKLLIKSIYRLFTELGYVIPYRRFKQIIFGNIIIENYEYKLKTYFDMFVMMLLNKERVLNTHFIKMITTEFNLSHDFCYQTIVDQINKPYRGSIEEILSIININVYNSLSELSFQDNFLLSYYLVSYYFFKKTGKIFRLTVNSVKEYHLLLKERNEEKLILWYLNTIKQTEEPDVAYYRNLIPLNKFDIVNKILERKELIERQYHITNIILYGSFTNETYRIDSDIDLLVTFNYSLSYTDKLIIIKDFKTYLLGVFNRRIDVMEYRNQVTDDMIIELENAIIIF